MAGAGTRRGGFQLDISDTTKLFVRWARRGGLLAHLNRDIYFGLYRRLMREITVATASRRRGIPVVETLGALLEPLILGTARGAIITRAMPGMTLWELLQVEDDPTVCSHLIEEARRVIAIMHQGGLDHADLNLHNLFVTRSGEQMTVVLLDLDRARLYPAPLKKELQRRNLARLRRSAKKLDRAGRFIDAHALQILTGA